VVKTKKYGITDCMMVGSRTYAYA